jgi:hypothetical protein
MLEGTRTQSTEQSQRGRGRASQSDRDSRLPTDKMLQPIRRCIIRRRFLLGTPAEKAGSDVIRAISNGLRLFSTCFPLA